MESATHLIGHGTPHEFIAVDPGKRCGFLHWKNNAWQVSTIALAELPHALSELSLMDFVAIENYSLTGGNRRNDPSMPASQGIGMARMACYIAGIPLYVVQRASKRAGHQALNGAGLEAWQKARNDHERDVVDIGGFVLREAQR